MKALCTGCKTLFPVAKVSDNGKIHVYIHQERVWFARCTVCSRYECFEFYNDRFVRLGQIKTLEKSEASRINVAKARDVRKETQILLACTCSIGDDDATHWQTHKRQCPVWGRGYRANYRALRKEEITNETV